jgi:hypothetical protein
MFMGKSEKSVDAFPGRVKIKLLKNYSYLFDRVCYTMLRV